MLYTSVRNKERERKRDYKYVTRYKSNKQSRRLNLVDNDEKLKRTLYVSGQNREYWFLTEPETVDGDKLQRLVNKFNAVLYE